MLKIIFVLILFSHSRVYAAPSCEGVFVSARPLWNESIYKSAFDTYKNHSGVEDTIEIVNERLARSEAALFAKVQSGQTVSIEEVVGFLDANIPETDNLASKIQRFLVRSDVYQNSLFRIFGPSPTVKTKGQKLYLTREELKSDSEVKIFITQLLQSVYALEKASLKVEIYKLNPRFFDRTGMLAQTDEFYYKNQSLFSPWMVLPKRDSIWAGTFPGTLLSYFLFFIDDPFSAHRLNAHDHLLERTSTNLDELKRSYRFRMMAPAMTNFVQRRIFTAGLVTSIILLPVSLYHGIPATLSALHMINTIDTAALKKGISEKTDANFNSGIEMAISELEKTKSQQIQSGELAAAQFTALKIKEFEKYRQKN